MKPAIALATLFVISVGLELPTSALAATASPTTGIIDDTAAGWVWSGMGEYDSDSLVGGTGYAGGPGSP